jgi:hypothetical protein
MNTADEINAHEPIDELEVAVLVGWQFIVIRRPKLDIALAVKSQQQGKLKN